MVTTIGGLVQLNHDWAREETDAERTFKILQGMHNVLGEIAEDWKIPGEYPADEEYYARMDVLFRRKRKVGEAMDVQMNAMVAYEELLLRGSEYVKGHKGDDADTELDAEFIKEYSELEEGCKGALRKVWDKGWVRYRELAWTMHEKFRKEAWYDSEMNWEAFRGYAEHDIECEAQGVLMERELQGE